ncbi:HEAT repeat domain-containing protein [Streptomyces sp. NPDC001773]
MGDEDAGGPGGARERLIAALRRSRAERGMNQTDLAKAAGLSTAAVSNILNGKSVPGTDTLDMLAKALGITGQALRELHRLRERADSRVRRLDSYLDAAQRAAHEHPYPGVLPGTMPPLAAVYLRQQATQLADLHEQAGGEDADLSGEEVLAGGHICAVLAGPGGGKSSLLRTRLASGTARWAAGRGEDMVPVLVSAVALADLPLAQALATAVSRDLASYGLVEELPPAFFAGPPQPGVAWQVLVDGLDEVADPAVRRRVLRKLAAVAGGDYASLYRFVVASRPLAPGELDLLGSDVPRYSLQPFSSDDVERVACGWFQALGLPDPGQAVAEFCQQLRHGRLAGLARIPLMTSMLCQLHATAPQRALPASRGDIYRDFIALLHERQHARSLTPDPTGLGRYGPGALAQAEHTLDHLHDVIAHLAAERHRGRTVSAIQIVEALPQAQRPQRVPVEAWRTFLHVSLGGSGLLTDRDGDLVFLHHTLLEYMAARHATRDPETTAHTLRQVFHQPARCSPLAKLLAGGPPGVRPRMWPFKYWQPPRQDSSLVGFLIDAAQASSSADCTRYLARFASRRAGLYGCEFIIRQVELGTAVPGEVLRATAGLLLSLATAKNLDGPDRMRAIDALAKLDDQPIADLLHTLATDTTLGSRDRMRAIDALAKLDDQPIADLLHTLATDTAVDRYGRRDAARALVELGDQRAADVFHTLATNTTIDRFMRQNAAEALVELGDQRAADVFHTLATNITFDTFERLDAAEALANLGDQRGTDVLHTLATDTTIGDHVCVDAAARLAQLGDLRAAKALHALATGTTLYPAKRLDAAAALVKLGDQRGADLLHALIADTTVKDDVRRDAAEALVRLGGQCAADPLYTVATDISIGEFVRVDAAAQMAKLGDQRGADLLHTLATDITNGGHMRVEAARRMAQLGDQRSADLLHTLATDTTLDTSRLWAGHALVRLGDQRAADVFHTLATDTTLDTSDRLNAAEALADLGDQRAADPLHTLIIDTVFDKRERRKRAQALARLGDQRGADLLYTLATDTNMPDSDRVDAADVLAEVGDRRAPDLLHSLATDTTLIAYFRQEAADSLARLDASMPPS